MAGWSNHMSPAQAATLMRIPALASMDQAFRRSVRGEGRDCQAVPGNTKAQSVPKERNVAPIGLWISAGRTFPGPVGSDFIRIAPFTIFPTARRSAILTQTNKA